MIINTGGLKMEYVIRQRNTLSLLNLFKKPRVKIKSPRILAPDTTTFGLTNSIDKTYIENYQRNAYINNNRIL